MFDNIYKAWHAVGADVAGLKWGDFVKHLSTPEPERPAVNQGWCNGCTPDNCHGCEGRYIEQPVQDELAELTAQRDKLADILTRTANALKGQPAELAQHSWHDLPEVAQRLKAAQQDHLK